MSRPAEPIPGWWETPALAFAEGARVGYEAGLREALLVAADLYGPWRFDADEVVRGLQRRGLWPPGPRWPGGSSSTGDPASPQPLEPSERLRT